MSPPDFPANFPPNLFKMAEPKKTAQGTWRISIEVKGARASKTLPTRREAVEWRDRSTVELLNAAAGKASRRHTLGDALRRYAEEVSPTHRGERWEIVRLAAYAKAGSLLPVGRQLGDLTTMDLAAWRDARLRLVARGSVLRDLGLLSAVLEHARREWKWIDVNPMLDVGKPQTPDHRDVVIGGLQVRKMVRQLGYACSGIDKRKVRSVSQAVALCFTVALATGMRAGELCSLTWAHVHATHVTLPITKNGRRRDVPLSPTAIKLIASMRGFDDVLVFGVKSQTLDALFRRARDRAGLSGFTFHDARHTAATRMALLPGIDVLTLCKIFGWSNTSQALTYYNPHAKDIAKRLG